MINPISPIRPISTGTYISAIEALKPIGANQNNQAQRIQNSSDVTFPDMIRQAIKDANFSGTVVGANQAQEMQRNSSGAFPDMIRQLIEDANLSGAQTKANANNLAFGVTDTALHNIEIDALRADLALRTLTSVRTKVLEAYQEVMRITV